MILVDTSVWVEHFARRNEAFATLLEENAVLIHPFVIGELALGHLRTREATLKTLRRLPQSGVATAHEILHLVEQHRLLGLASAMSMFIFSRLP